MKKYTIYITKKYIATAKIEIDYFNEKTIEKMITIFRQTYGKETQIEIVNNEQKE